MFHSDRHELHGMTVVVETDGPMTYIGRCHDVDDEKVVLLDVGEHEEGRDGARSEFVDRAAAVGIWAKHTHMVVPRERVTAIRRLGDIAS